MLLGDLNHFEVGSALGAPESHLFSLWYALGKLLKLGVEVRAGDGCQVRVRRVGERSPNCRTSCAIVLRESSSVELQPLLQERQSDTVPSTKEVDVGAIRSTNSYDLRTFSVLWELLLLFRR